MSNTFATDVGAADAMSATPRVRHLAREALSLIVFSAVTSTALAGCLMLLMNLGHQG